MMSRLTKILMALTLVAVAASGAQAAVPATLTHEGRLLDKNGAPVTTNQILIYKIYDVPTGGTAMWTETLTVMFDQGYFSAQLGATMPISNALLAGGPRFLGIQVGADEEMTPREALGSVPYARLAGEVSGDIHPTSVSVAGATVIDAAGKWVGPVPVIAGNCTQVLGACGSPTYNLPTYYLDRVGGTCPMDRPIFNGFRFQRCGVIDTAAEGMQLAMTCCQILRAP